MALARAFSATFAGGNATAPAALETASSSAPPPSSKALPSSAPLSSSASLPPHHGCPLCPPNLCKGAALRRLRVERPFARVAYAGDGAGDLCPALSLGPGDVLLARRGHRLAHILAERREQGLSVGGAQIELWDDAEDLRALVEKATRSQLESDRLATAAAVGPLLVKAPTAQPETSGSFEASRDFTRGSLNSSSETTRGSFDPAPSVASMSLPGSCFATQPPSEDGGSEAPTPRANPDAPIDVDREHTAMLAGKLWA